MGRRNVTSDNMNPNLKKMEYAVRGPLVTRAAEIENELSQGIKKPFNEVIRANIVDWHAMGQKPLTFIRQVLSLCSYPALMADDKFPDDVKKRVQDILNDCGGNSVGAYSSSTGIEIIKQHVAQFIERRDGYPADSSDIILSAGVTEAVRLVFSLLNYTGNGKPPGIMVTIPQYPLYSSAIAECGMHQINYYLDEDNDWALNITEMRKCLDESKKCCEPRALVVINPGNPTGSVLTHENIKEIIEFAYEEKLILLADEVYQDNVSASGLQFHSLKKVMMEMGKPYNSVELVSLMSASKGYVGESGLRGGYAEIINIDTEVKKMLLNSISSRMCPGVLGQVAVDCVVNTPQKGEPSYDLFIKEKMAVFECLKEHALMIKKTFSNMKGVKCNIIAGAMYAFPRLTLPEKAIQKAKSLGLAPDFFYAMQLLENAGVCVVPGSGFGQIPGTYHIRFTILPIREKLKAMLQRLEEFHKKFLEEYE